MYINTNPSLPNTRTRRAPLPRARRASLPLSGFRGGYRGLGDECVVQANGARVCYPNGYAPGSQQAPANTEPLPGNGITPATQQVCTPTQSGPRYKGQSVTYKPCGSCKNHTWQYQYQSGDLDVYMIGSPLNIYGTDWNWAVASPEGGFYAAGGQPPRTPAQQVCTPVVATPAPTPTVTPVAYPTPAGTMFAYPAGTDTTSLLATPINPGFVSSPDTSTAAPTSFLDSLPSWAKWVGAGAIGLFVAKELM